MAAATKKSKQVPEIYAQRLKRVRKAMSGNDLPAYLVTNRMDHYYLTGFTGEDSAILVTPKQVHVISDGRFDESIDSECPWAQKHLRKGLLEAEIGKVCKELKLKEVGVQGDYVTLESHAAIRKAARPTKVKTAPSIVNDLRICKDSSELRVIKDAIKIAQDAFTALCKWMEPGMTEQQLAARLEYEMQVRGAVGVAFPSIVAEGPNASLPHAVPGKRKIKPNSMILFDWGAIYRFYRSDLTRVVFMGSIPPKFRKIYGIVKEAKEKATAVIRPGVRMCDVDAVARDHIKEAGFGEYFGHGLGHGLGLDTHEAPSLSWRSDAELQEGMVVTVEPGIYLPGAGGIRIEDDVVVTSKGARLLSSLSTELEEFQLSK